MPGLAWLVDTVRAASGGRTRLFIQIIDFLTIRRRAAREAYLGRFLQVTDEHREMLVLCGVDDGQVRAAEAGFDGVELHYAHARDLSATHGGRGLTRLTSP